MPHSIERTMRSVAPVATALIPTRNRRELLGTVLEAILAQSVPVEVIVLDDGSTDGTADWVREQFPVVRVCRTEVSQGPTYQRNQGALLATTPYLFTIDDDCLLASPHTIAQTIALMDDRQVGAVTIPFMNIKADRIVRSVAPDSNGVYATFEFYGGMVAFRRDAFLKLGGYRTSYFMYVEESDLALRMLEEGYLVRLGSADPIHHYESVRRDFRRTELLGRRNDVLYAWHNVPWPYLPLHLAATTANGLMHGLRVGRFGRMLLGSLNGYAACLRHWCDRRPVARSVYRLSRLLKKQGAVAVSEISPLLPPGCSN